MTFYEKLKKLDVYKFKIKYDIEILQELTELEKHKLIEYELTSENKVIITMIGKNETNKIKSGLLKELENKNSIDTLKRKFNMLQGYKKFNYIQNVRTLLNKEQFEKVIELYKQDLPYSEIAEITDLEKGMIHELTKRWCLANGVQRRKERGINLNGSIRKKQLMEK